MMVIHFSETNLLKSVRCLLIQLFSLLVGRYGPGSGLPRQNAKIKTDSPPPSPPSLANVDAQFYIHRI